MGAVTFPEGTSVVETGALKIVDVTIAPSELVKVVRLADDCSVPGTEADASVLESDVLGTVDVIIATPELVRVARFADDCSVLGTGTSDTVNVMRLPSD